jgi:hypothetical protein
MKTIKVVFISAVVIDTLLRGGVIAARRLTGGAPATNCITSRDVLILLLAIAFHCVTLIIVCLSAYLATYDGTPSARWQRAAKLLIFVPIALFFVARIIANPCIARPADR